MRYFLPDICLCSMLIICCLSGRLHAEETKMEVDFDGTKTGITLTASLDDNGVVLLRMNNITSNRIRTTNSLSLAILEWNKGKQAGNWPEKEEEILINGFRKVTIEPDDDIIAYRGDVRKQEEWSKLQGIVQFLARPSNSNILYVSNPIMLADERNKTNGDMDGDIIEYTFGMIADQDMLRESDTLYKKMGKRKEPVEVLRAETKRNLRELYVSIRHFNDTGRRFPHTLSEIYERGVWTVLDSFRSPARTHSEDLVIDYGMADLNKAEPDAFTVVLWDKPGNWPDGGYVAFYNGMRKFIAVEKDTWREIEGALTTRKGKEIVKKYIPEANVDDFED